ncbi:hypothetical protein [Devosia enhydra]|uniref:hypothetical protein n=1 Tax=Devosia enhydra TaxID=665118 RepID=UPI0015A5C5D4|nr:hypothetical protein [Devosia enhydra]
MGKLLSFTAKPETDRKPPPPGAMPGKLLLFTGIRYERSEAPQPDKPDQRSGSRRRRG